MAKATPKPKTVQPDLAKHIRQTLPILRQVVRNLRNYGVSEDEVVAEVSAVY